MPFSLACFLESSLNRHGVPVVRRDQPQRPHRASPPPLSNTQRAFLLDFDVIQYRRNSGTNELERVPERAERERRPVRVVLQKKKKRPERMRPRTVVVKPEEDHSDDESTLVDYTYVEEERKSPRRRASWVSSGRGSDRSGSRGSPRPAPSPQYFDCDVEDREASQYQRHQQYQRQHQHHPHRRHSKSYSYSPYENINIETRSPRARPSTSRGYPSFHSYSYSPYEGVNIETRSPDPRPRPCPRPTPSPNRESRYGFRSTHREDPYAGVNIEDRSPRQGPAYEHQHQNESQRQYREDLRSPGYQDRDRDTDDERTRGVRFTEFDETRTLRDGATILERTPRLYSRGGRGDA